MRLRKRVVFNVMTASMLFGHQLPQHRERQIDNTQASDYVKTGVSIPKKLSL
jgi:hypothetical protein